ncbi:hypothetical protein ASPWEDRAFT_44411 [Aspergillus wentii DTO 134E9]|uniref:Secreted protein n=1 Tax=Aspergillus wentii DTO 134E9 TaxID=1073089 RepID=A0A1L9RBM8_ASPWE|nr:uncharacterized protein ASPWEDRAFT_44411 [Aspergillus wentii DTO 134E9]OJJ32319.1 hypothetical protein ASPWEDRAFT_44411 [Aspergillus wentii DTO 134E9]
MLSVFLASCILTSVPYGVGLCSVGVSHTYHITYIIPDSFRLGCISQHSNDYLTPTEGFDATPPSP